MKTNRVAVGFSLLFLLSLIVFLIVRYGFGGGDKDEEEDESRAGGEIPSEPEIPSELQKLEPKWYTSFLTTFSSLNLPAPTCMNNLLNNIDLDIGRFNALMKINGEIKRPSDEDILRVLGNYVLGDWTLNKSFIAAINKLKNYAIPVTPTAEGFVVALEKFVEPPVCEAIVQDMFKLMPNAGAATVISSTEGSSGPLASMFPQGVTIFTFISLERVWYMNETVKQADAYFNNPNGVVIQPSHLLIRNENLTSKIAGVCNF